MTTQQSTPFRIMTPKTPVSLRERYAYDWNTLPKYVYQNAQGQWKNWEEEISNYPSLKNPLQIYHELNDQAQVPLNLEPKDILFFYVIRNRPFQQFAESMGWNMFYIQETLGIDENTEQIILEIKSRFYNSKIRPKILQRVEQAKKQFRESFLAKQAERIQQEKERKELGELVPVPFTSFVVEHITKTYKVNENIIGSLYTLFNNIILNEEFPLAVSFQYYKVLKGYHFVLDIPEQPDTLFLFSNNQGKIEIVKTEQSFEVSYDYTQQENDQEFLEQICQCIGIQSIDLELIQETMNGKCTFPEQQLNLTIWKDVVMNQPDVKDLLVINENPSVAHKLPSERKIIRKAFQMYVIQPDGKKNTLNVLPSEEGVSVRIQKVINPKDAKVIQEILSNALGMYNLIGEKIAKKYNQILGSKIVEYQPPIRQVRDYNKPLKEIAPKMFLPNYTRTCMHLPSIVTPEEAEELEQKEGYQVMKFPKDDEEFPSFYFSCHKHEKHIYPGLRKNILGNKKQFPLLPCCYIENQKRKNIYKNYFDTQQKLSDFVKEDKEITIEQIQQRFLISDKFVGVKQTGKCSEELTEWFMTYSVYKPVRRGVHRSKWSALECILTQLDYQSFRQERTEDKLKMIHREIRKFKQADLSLCAQECWNFANPEQLIDEDIYFDLRYFIRLVEYTYKCRVILLDRTNFIHPNFIQGYFRWRHREKYPIVMLYEHYGSESDQAQYPQCEIIELDTHNTGLTSANHDTVFQDIAERMYQDYIQTFYTLTPSPSIIEESFIDRFEEEYTILEQHIDYYGKVFALNVQTPEKHLLTLFFETHRLPPMIIATSKTIHYLTHSDSRFVRITERKSITEIVGIKCYALTREQPESLLEAFEKTQQQVTLMIENAKRIYAERLEKGIPKEQLWDFIQVSDKVEKYSRFFFSDSTLIPVTNAETKKRLIYALTVYSRRFETELKQYLNEDLVFPFKYQSVQDFDEQEQSIVAENDNVINWYTHFYDLMPIDGTLYTRVFICLVRGVLYKCTPIEHIPNDWTNYTLMFPQVKKEFQVGIPEEGHVLLMIQNQENIRRLYQCAVLPKV